MSATTLDGPASLTPRQREILDWIVTSTTRRKIGPTLREIGAHFSISSPNGVLCHLRALEAKGFITRDPKLSRSIVAVAAPPRRDELAELRAALRLVLDKARVVPPAEPDEGPVAVSIVLSKWEYEAAVMAFGGTSGGVTRGTKFNEL